MLAISAREDVYNYTSGIRIIYVSFNFFVFDYLTMYTIIVKAHPVYVCVMFYHYILSLCNILAHVSRSGTFLILGCTYGVYCNTVFHRVFCWRYDICIVFNRKGICTYNRRGRILLNLCIQNICKHCFLVA